MTTEPTFSIEGLTLFVADSVDINAAATAAARAVADRKPRPLTGPEAVYVFLRRAAYVIDQRRQAQAMLKPTPRQGAGTRAKRNHTDSGWSK